MEIAAPVLTAFCAGVLAGLCPMARGGGVLALALSSFVMFAGSIFAFSKILGG